jgi:rare lipoprotein A
VTTGRGARAATLLILAAGALASGCTLGSKANRAREGRRGFEQVGVASWYGPGFHGRLTANGETYDMEAMTAAHKQLPFGSLVEVENRDNGRRTRVRINDRGPFVRGRIIDLSKAAARQLEMLGPGIARVRIRVVGRSGSSSYQTQGSSPSPADGGYTVQAGAFRDLGRADARLAAVRRLFADARIESSSGLHRVVLAGLTRGAAAAARKQLERNGIEAVILR